MTEPFTITLPDPVISRPRRGTSPSLVDNLLSDCPKCNKPIEVADRIRKVGGAWLHNECAIAVIGSMSVADKWLMLAEHVSHAPSAFRASQIRTIVRAVVEIADSHYDDESDVWGEAS